jgi:hypothetical protein
VLDLLTLANAGTPLIWASLCVLLVGNIGIGLLEALLLRVLFKAEINPGWLIGANYGSMAVGALIVGEYGHSGPGATDPFQYAMPTVFLFWLIAFLVTIVVEWPIFSIAAGRFGFRVRGLVFSVWINTLSYVVISLLAVLLCQTSAVSQTQLVSATSLQVPPGWVYYLSPDSQELRRVRTDGSQDSHVGRVEVKESLGGSWTRLTVESRKGNKRGSLYLRTSRAATLMRANIAEPGTFATAASRLDDDSYLLGNITFGSDSSLAWTYPAGAYNGFWAAEGLTINGKRYAFDTPFLMIRWRSVTVLPDRKILAVFGDQVVLFDPQTGRIAVLARGHGPALALDEPVLVEHSL